MKSFAQALVLALALGCTSANINHPTVKMNVGHNNLGKGLSVDSLKGDIQVESRVNDDLSVGVNVDNSENPLRSVFAKFTNK